MYQLRSERIDRLFYCALSQENILLFFKNLFPTSRRFSPPFFSGTSRVLETRIKEHLSRDSSAVHEHRQLTGHSVDSSKTKVLATESNTFKRRIREAIEIRLRKPSLNRDNGFELANIYNTILGPLRPL